MHDKSNDDFLCLCKLFKRVGYQCRHVYFALWSENIGMLPRKYVLNRWTKNAIQMSSMVGDQSPNLQCKEYASDKKFMMAIWSEFQACVLLAAADDAKLERLTFQVREMRIDLEADVLVS